MATQFLCIVVLQLESNTLLSLHDMTKQMFCSNIIENEKPLRIRYRVVLSIKKHLKVHMGKPNIKRPWYCFNSEVRSIP